MTICDVSYYQGVIDWHKMAGRAAGVIIRAGFGLSLDPLFVKNWQDSKEVIQRGAYWYFRADKSPTEQANLLLRYATEPDLPLVIDLEWRQSTDGIAAKPGYLYLAQVTEFLKVLVDAGHWPVIYSSYGHILSYLPRPAARTLAYEAWADLAGYRLWLAQYSKDARITLPAPNVPQPWINYWMWQCVADGNGLGPMFGASSKAIDLNRENW